jgi:hypothetical protein
MARTRMRMAAAATAAAGLALSTGCGDSSRQPAAEAKADAEKAVADADRLRLPSDPTAKVPRPDADLIGYDPDTRTLVLYDLPDAAAKWMLHLPDQPRGVPVNVVHRFMEEVDADKVAVFYTTAAGQPSPRVTLRDILSARDTRAQR